MSAMHSFTFTRRGFMFILSSPSGAGKTTLSRRLLADEKDIAMSVSVTTRAMRPGEREGVDYFFVTREAFEQKVHQGELLEHATVFSNYYGTPKDFVLGQIESGHDVLFDIDWQGTHQLKASNLNKDIVSVFILPPSMLELERRLQSRAQDSEDVVKFRMERAAGEIMHWDEYDYVVVNYDIESSLQEIKHILHAERQKRERQKDLPAFVDFLMNERSQS